MKHSVLDTQNLTQSRAEIKNLPFKTNSQRIFKYRVVLQPLTEKAALEYHLVNPIYIHFTHSEKCVASFSLAGCTSTRLES